MFWSLSFQLLPDEIIVDDSLRRDRSAIRPAYSVFLTNRRAIFRFDGLGSSMTQSFFYEEIQDARPSKRLFFSYLLVKTEKKEFLLNTSDAEYWAEKILEIRQGVTEYGDSPLQQRPLSPERRKRELLDMLTVLRKNELLTDDELEQKIHLLDSMKF
jgi:hypothetical protein